jgi:biotin carboxylase
MKKILVINLGWEQEPLLDLIGSQDFLVYGVHYNDDYYKGILYRDIFITDLRDIKRILQFAEKVKPDAVISDQCDYSQFVQALIASRFNIPGPQIRDAQIGNNKYLQRTIGHNMGILSPNFSLCLDVQDVYNFANSNGFPIILKPVDNRGSFGVNRIDNRNEVDNAFFDAVINSHSRLVLAEKYIDGVHLTVDGYIFKGIGPKALAVANKKKLKQKRSIIDGQIMYPADLPTDLYNKAVDTFENISKLYGFKFGFLHGEFIISKSKEIYLTEISNRGGGVFTSEIIVPNVSGIDLNSLYINDCLGEERFLVDCNLENIQKNPTIMKFFVFNDQKEGIVKHIKGLDYLKAQSNILKIKLLLRKGDVIRQISSGSDRHGVIIMTAPETKDLLDSLKIAINTLEVQIEEH